MESPEAATVPLSAWPVLLALAVVGVVWHAACAANISGRRVPHDFRRTAARSYRRSGVSEGVVMTDPGHKTRSMFERYNIKNEDDLREAASAVAERRRDVLGQSGANRASVVPITSQPKGVTL